MSYNAHHKSRERRARNSAGAEALAVAGRPAEASTEKKTATAGIERFFSLSNESKKKDIGPRRSRSRRCPPAWCRSRSRRWITNSHHSPAPSWRPSPRSSPSPSCPRPTFFLGIPRVSAAWARRDSGWTQDVHWRVARRASVVYKWP